jgi:hypothetical protein
LHRQRHCDSEAGETGCWPFADGSPAFSALARPSVRPEPEAPLRSRPSPQPLAARPGHPPRRSSLAAAFVAIAILTLGSIGLVLMWAAAIDHVG